MDRAFKAWGCSMLKVHLPVWFAVFVQLAKTLNTRPGELVWQSSPVTRSIRSRSDATLHLDRKLASVVDSFAHGRSFRRVDRDSGTTAPSIAMQL